MHEPLPSLPFRVGPCNTIIVNTYSIITFIERYAEFAISLESISTFSALGLNVHWGSNLKFWPKDI
jgi:hypothetical protein